MDVQKTPAIAVERLVKRHKGVGAVDGISFKLAAGSVTGLLGGNGAGKNKNTPMIMGLLEHTLRAGNKHLYDHASCDADIRRGQGAWRRDAARAISRAASDEFRKSLCRYADAPDGASKSVSFCGSLRGAGYPRTDRKPFRPAGSDRVS